MRGTADIGVMPFMCKHPGRLLGVALAVAAAVGAPASSATAQTASDSTMHDSASAARKAPTPSRHHYWRRMAAGFATQAEFERAGDVVGLRLRQGRQIGRPVGDVDAIEQPLPLQAFRR